MHRHSEALKKYIEAVSPSRDLDGAAESLAAAPQARTRSALESRDEAPARGPLADANDAESGLRKLRDGRDPTPREQFAIEAIILPGLRPVVDVRNDSFELDPSEFSYFSQDAVVRARLEKALPSIGCVELPGHPDLPYGGTAFVVGPGLLMTNRHVAEIFTSGWGREGLAFKPNHASAIDFQREVDSVESRLLRVDRVRLIHPYWDMAVLEVAGLEGRAPLCLSLAAPEDLINRDIAVVGYPGFDPRNNAAVQNEVFRGRYYIKRLQPGRLTGRRSQESYGKNVNAATHDASTLGGNSGSCVIDVRTGAVVALHFAGIYQDANFAVPASELARDSRVVDLGLNFSDEPEPDDPPEWQTFWLLADPGGERSPVVPETPPNPPTPGVTPDGPTVAAGGVGPAIVSQGADGSVTWVVPLEVTVRVGAPMTAGLPGVVVPAGAPAPVEAAVEVFHDHDYGNRPGYDAEFLGVEVALPAVTDESVAAKLEDGSMVLRYHHFSLVMHKKRRLALYTASNVDASRAMRRPDPDRPDSDYTRDALGGLGEHDSERWFTDPRIPEIHQLPDRFFSKDRGAFDRGHIVRRDDVAWGISYRELRFANGDTFHTTNCSPQVKDFNRSTLAEDNWGDLENEVLRQARSERLCVFAGPVLADDDPVFSGFDLTGTVEIPIPQRYWKVIAARSGDDLQMFAFLLEQDLANVKFEFAVPVNWRSKQVSVADLEAMLDGLEFPRSWLDADQA